MTRAAVLLALLLAMPSAAAAQAPPDCASDKVANVTLRTQELGQEATPVATHEIDVSADILASDPTQIVITPQDGVDVLQRGGNGSIVVLFARVRRISASRSPGGSPRMSRIPRRPPDAPPAAP